MAESSNTQHEPPEEVDTTEGNSSQLLTEQEIDEFIMREQIAASEGNNSEINSKYTPQLGMQFENKEQAQHFFNFYAWLAGFQTVVAHVARTTSKKRNNEITKLTIKCHRYGKAPKKKTTEEQEGEVDKDIGKMKGKKRKTNIAEKTDCQCVMVIKEDANIWKIIRLDLDHNHELYPGQSNQQFSGHKYMTDMEKSLIRTLNDNNIATRQMISIISYLRGGPTALPVKKKDISNFRTKINREIKGTDMTKVLDNFRKKKSEDPTFFYKFELDDENRMKNIFWRDGSSLKYYADFGDCVSFDTTYMTNRYRLPFAPFVGITGHAQTCIFGCAFLKDETIATFKWLFETFLESMGGKHPQTIITDQDKAMKTAIEEVMPNTRHRNCLFHIKTKCYSKNIKVFAANDGLYEEFEDIVNNSVTEEEFENLWREMIRERGLENNKYLTKMWETRKRFIPVYYKNDFFPFIQSTSRSEATNARFKQNVGPTYSINSFVAEYDRIVDSIERAENLEDHYSNQKRPKELLYGYTFEKQAQELYNRNIYKKFQIQLQATSTLTYKEIEEGKQFEVWQRSNQVYKAQRIRRYIVLTNLTQGNEDFSCICAKFSKDGILCSHILKIMIEKEISAIPDKYIIDRWRKKDMRLIRKRVEETTIATNSLLRFNVLSRKSAAMNSKAAKTEEATDYLVAEMERINLHLDKLLAPKSIGETQSEPIADEQVQTQGLKAYEDNYTQNQLEDPERIQNKGRPEKPKRMKAVIEEAKEKAKKKENKKKKKQTTNENSGTIYNSNSISLLTYCNLNI